MIKVRRVYEPATAGEGARLLVDRLWPRGLKKEDLHLEGWVKEVAPSDSLRRWFGHKPGRWSGFRRRYFSELDRKPEACRPILKAARRGDVILLYAAKDDKRNNAVALREYLLGRLRGK